MFLHIIIYNDVLCFVWVRGGCQTDNFQGEWRTLKTLVRQTFQDKSYSSLWQTLSTKEPYNVDYKVMYTFYHFYSTSCNSLPNWVDLFLISTVVCFISRTYCTLLK